MHATDLSRQATSSSEPPIPTKLRYPNYGIQDARALGELLQRSMDYRSNPSTGRHFVRRGARQWNRPTQMLPSDADASESGKQPDATTPRTRALRLSPVFDLGTERSLQ